ncbi:hypothetical protein Vid5_gp94 [Pantoea phage vB_PagS_Vid5]|uniref:YspA cpYpsA-related SLOG domain-containing protein n=1 Tax=Pantoea phage vB_PagS_Vid5 TaxID=2099652 RepID=A0A2P1CKW7_9CAUD|nr:GTP-binding domain [Pantoea phage vB_PagS_Vid5]AVJ51849.1 hypothetical protein Vid5_gp94 [Pantoea phage vB_PagS_Vid5]
MIVVVTGGRDYNDCAAITAALDALHTQYPITMLYHGCARGVDTLCGLWASARGVPVREFPADWENCGPRAGLMRNIEMIASNPRPVYCIAFPGGTGTAHMVKHCKIAGVPVWQPYHPNPENL